MPIHQVTHVNHVDDDGGAIVDPIDPADALAALAIAEDRVGERKYFVRNPKLLMQDARELQTAMRRGRNSLDAAGRLTQAEMWKAGSNRCFTDGKSHAALVGYLVGLWYLRSGSPQCPLLIAHAMTCAKEKEAEVSLEGLRDVPAFLQGLGTDDESSAAAPAPAPAAVEVSDASESAPDSATAAEAGTDGAPAGSAGDAEGAARAAALRVSLHLNVAAAALKLLLWPIVKAACEAVLRVEPSNSKALFRLAKAHEGEGDLKAAVAALVTLIKGDKANGDARRMLDAVKRRQADEREKFKGMFAKGAGDGERPPPRPPRHPPPTRRRARARRLRRRGRRTSRRGRRIRRARRSATPTRRLRSAGATRSLTFDEPPRASATSDGTQNGYNYLEQAPRRGMLMHVRVCWRAYNPRFG